MGCGRDWILCKGLGMSSRVLEVRALRQPGIGAKPFPVEFAFWRCASKQSMTSIGDYRLWTFTCSSETAHYLMLANNSPTLQVIFSFTESGYVAGRSISWHDVRPGANTWGAS